MGDAEFKKKCLRINITKGNYWIMSFGLMASYQKVPKFDFSSQFSMSKIIWIFLVFFIEKYQFRSTILFPHLVWKWISKMMPYFYSSLLFENYLHQGGVKSTVSWVFEDLKFKISEESDQNWCFPDPVRLAVSV